MKIYIDEADRAAIEAVYIAVSAQALAGLSTTCLIIFIGLFGDPSPPMFLAIWVMFAIFIYCAYKLATLDIKVIYFEELK